MKYKQDKNNMKYSRFLQTITRSCAAAVLAISGFTALLLPTALAAGSASFSLSPGSGSYTTGQTFSVTVAENGTNIQGVQVNLAYDSSYLQYNSISESGSPFGEVAQSTGGGGSVAVGSASISAQSGTQTIAVVSFTALKAGTGTVHFVAGSGATTTDILDNNGTSVWNGSLPSASYTLSAPAPPPSSGGGGTTTGGSSSTTTSSGSSSSTKKTTTTSPTTSTTAPTTPQPTPQAPPSVTNTAPKLTTATPVGVLTVTVTDKQGKPVNKAAVSVDGMAPHYTNVSGVVTFQQLATGKHTVAVSFAGDGTVKETVTLPAGQMKQVSVKLASASKLLAIGLIVVCILVVAALAAYWLWRNRRRNGGAGAGTPDISTPVIVGTPNGPITPPSSPATSVTPIAPPAPPADVQVISPTNKPQP